MGVAAIGKVSSAWRNAWMEWPHAALSVAVWAGDFFLSALKQKPQKMDR